MSELMVRDYDQEPPQNMALAQVVSEGDPETMLQVLEKKAELAPRMKAAIEKILVNQTYEQDWKIMGDKACLSSAGAERVGLNFPIQYEQVAYAKQEFHDEDGPGYIYLYTGYVSLNNRKVFAQGAYSTRDKFLGLKDNKWRPLSEINEDHIRAAAYHFFCGNAIKELLGLRNIPCKEFDRIMKGLGLDPGKSGDVGYGQGTHGGKSVDDHQGQKELGEICIAIANAGQSVAKDQEGNFYMQAITADDPTSPIEVAKNICATLSGFTGKDGKTVSKNSVKELKGKWLASTLAKARQLYDAFQQAPPAKGSAKPAGDSSEEAISVSEFFEAIGNATATPELDDYELKLSEHADLSDQGKRKILEAIMKRRSYLTRGQRSNKKQDDLFPDTGK